jgi:hypothetical protein
VELCLDLMAVASRIDDLWLMSGSRDLERMVETLRTHGLKICLINAEGMVPRELRNAVDQFVDLAQLRPQLEKAVGIRPLGHQPSGLVRGVPAAAEPPGREVAMAPRRRVGTSHSQFDLQRSWPAIPAGF